MRLFCPSAQPECQGQAPPPPGDGCGKELDWWFTPEARHLPQGPAKPLLLADLPRACTKLVGAR
jgi:penicillin-insensitive murein endopeptidase